MNKFCDYVVPDPVFSNSSILYLKSRRKNEYSYSQAELYYSASSIDEGSCGGELFNFYGIFSNPNYKQNQRLNQECRWNIIVPQHFNVSIRFEEFDMGTMNTCETNFVEIIEVTRDGDETPVQKYCGSDVPKIYQGMRNVLAVRFKKTVNFAGIGFLANFFASQDGIQI